RPRRPGEPGESAVQRLHLPGRGELLRRAAITLVAVGALASLAAGCGASASPESGITAFLRATNAQFVEGALTPDTSAGGSASISGVTINNTNVYPGEQNFPLSGTVTGATALVGLEND